jgi:aerobic-type carbon monoxide dehydrogenase small subunit (CoxS/CutS family)
MTAETHSIELRINGATVRADVEPRLSLVDFLRHHQALTGTHVGCSHGVCGACTVMVDGRTARSCIMFAVQANGRDVRTVEGLAEGDRLSVLQEEFRNHHALQCGYCTPGMLMSATALLAETPQPSEAEIRLALSGNLCRCTGYVNIVRAVKAAAERGKK